MQKHSKNKSIPKIQQTYTKEILKCNQTLLPIRYETQLKKQASKIFINHQDSINCYIQIDYNNQENQDLSESRKKNKNQKKKQRKKRNKIQKQKIKQQKIQELKLILTKIYSNLQTFESKKIQIIDVIRNVNQQKVFFDILNNAINQYIDRSAESIWFRLDEYINYDPDDLLTECPKLDQWPQFFILLINQLYDEYESISKASLEVQKIIQTFVIHYCNKSQNQQRGYNLTKNTFNHLISSNVFFEKFMKSCQNFLSVPNNIGFQDNKQAMGKLKQLIEIFDPCEYDQQQQYEQSENIDHSSDNSTQQTQQQCMKQDCEQNSKLKRRRKKNKKKDKCRQENFEIQQIECKCNTQQQHFERIYQRIQKSNLTLNNLISCDINQNLISQIEKKCIIKRVLDKK